MFRCSLNIQYGSKYLHCEDYALWLDLIGKTKFAAIPESLIRYRRYGGNISTLYADIQQEHSQYARYAAQRKYYGGKDETILDVFFQERSSLEDFMEAAHFCASMGKYGLRYHHLYHKALKKMHKNWGLVKFLWGNPINVKLGVTLKIKLKNTLRALVRR